MTKIRERSIWIHIVCPLVFGICLYWVMDPHILLFVKVPFEWNIRISWDKSGVVFRFIRNYFLDMLWAYSLIFALYNIFANDAAGLRKVFAVAFCFSAGMECLQLTQLAKGTFDVRDILFEFLAEIIAVFIIKKFYLGGDTK